MVGSVIVFWSLLIETPLIIYTHYTFIDDPVKTGKKKKRKLQLHDVDKQLDEDNPAISDETAVNGGRSDSIDDIGESPDELGSEIDEESDNESSSSTDIDEFTFDLNTPASEDIIHNWGEVARGGSVPHSDETSHRLAICNMDWDRISANDIFG